MTALVHREQELVQLLARPDTDDLAGQSRRHRIGEVDHPHRRDLGDEHLASDHVVEREEHEVDGLLEGDPEARHALVGDREAALTHLLAEDGDDRSSRTDHVSVPDAGESRLGERRVRVALHDDLLCTQLRGAVQVHRVHGLVGGERHHLLHARVDGSVDHVLCAEHVRAHGFERVVLTRRHLLHGRGVDDDVGSLRRSGHAGPITDVADQEADLAVAEAAEHLRLLQLVARVHPHHRIGPVAGHSSRERVTEGAGPAGEQNRRA